MFYVNCGSQSAVKKMKMKAALCASPKRSTVPKMAWSSVHIEDHDYNELDRDAEFGDNEEGMVREKMWMREDSVSDLVEEVNPTAKE